MKKAWGFKLHKLYHTQRWEQTRGIYSAGKKKEGRKVEITCQSLANRLKIKQRASPVGNCARCGTAMEPEVCGPTSWPTTPFKPFRSGLHHDSKNLVEILGCDWIPHLQKTSKETSPRRSADSHPNRSKERQSPIWLHSNDARKHGRVSTPGPYFPHW